MLAENFMFTRTRHFDEKQKQIALPFTGTYICKAFPGPDTPQGHDSSPLSPTTG
jgi:hypothetical protein